MNWICRDTVPVCLGWMGKTKKTRCRNNPFPGRALTRPRVEITTVTVSIKSLCFSRESNTASSAHSLVTMVTALQKASVLKSSSLSGSKFKEIKCHALRHSTLNIPSTIYTIALRSMRTVINANPSSSSSCEKPPLSRHFLESNTTQKNPFQPLRKQSALQAK